ncbi:response regulator transcription factor [Salinibacterium sp. M195]|uniref:response regulator n=1 Tax=Salinibacterium sp. M195 TaxID=2583374 RepID=UPI001C62F6A8|nr:response regulator transcription factor [Salinibacterium sp. M195]QYH36337.1 response regulator transcription factor [Salinibacterium sp. M195]
MSASPIRVLLADDHELVRAGFRVILSAQPDLEIIGEARNGREAVDLAAELHPDVICMDIQMPDLNGIDATRMIVADPEARAAVLILTTFDNEEHLFDALDAGASGFLLKNSSPDDLAAAIRTLASGDALLSPAVTRRVLQRVTRAARQAPRQTDAATTAELTTREREVLVLVAEGLSNAEIASALFVGEATVKTHVSKVLQKLTLRDRIQAIVFAYENGVVVPSSNRD